MIFFMAIGPRPDIAAAAETPRFLFKFVVTLALLATAFAALRALARPGASVRSALPILLVVPGLLLVAVGVELMSVPTDQLRDRWIGTNSLNLLDLHSADRDRAARGFYSLRSGMARRRGPRLPARSRAWSPVGLAATFYAMHCTDDLPLFVATWYPLAIAILAIAGALAGRLFVRW